MRITYGMVIAGSARFDLHRCQRGGENVSDYPVRLFSCREFSSKDIEGIFVLSAHLQQLCPGGIVGETEIPGLRLDFNNGLRLRVPKGKFHVRISDYDSEMVFFDEDVSEIILTSIDKYFVHWQVEVWEDENPVLTHIFDPDGEKVFFVFISEAIGDTLACMPYIGAFQKNNTSIVSYHAQPHLKNLIHRFYPDVPFQESVDEDTYATFYFGIQTHIAGFSPFDGHMIPLPQVGQMILGMDRPADLPRWKPRHRCIQTPYVCISVQASGIAKGWHYPNGWDIVVKVLKEKGYRVLCIDKNKHSAGGAFQCDMPAEAEDFTGDIPLEERADLLAYADFFIGLSSGLAWVAHSVGCPVVMICGFSEIWNEFYTPYRVYNRLVCHGCYNDVRVNWTENNCPRQAHGSEKVLECSKKISPRMVLQTVRRLIEDQTKDCKQ